MRWARHLYPEVFALLAGADDFFARQAFLEFGGAGADFAVDVGVVGGGDVGEGLVNKVFADEVDDLWSGGEVLE